MSRKILLPLLILIFSTFLSISTFAFDEEGEGKPRPIIAPTSPTYIVNK